MRRRAWATLWSGTIVAAGVTGAGTAGAAGGHVQPVHLHLDRHPAIIEAYTTYYGWYTNTPPGCTTAYSGCAHGTGSYRNPIIFASDKHEFPVGTILYDPTLKKYFVMGDECGECVADWEGRGPDGGPNLYHVDLWMGGQNGNESDLTHCEDAMTQRASGGAPPLTLFIVDPPATMPITSEPLFDTATDHCFGGATNSATYGRYENAKTGTCLSRSSGSARSPRAAVLAACGSKASQLLTFEGAFFEMDRACLQTDGSAYGSAIVFAACTRGPLQQWENGRHGTIAWIHYHRCITVTTSGTLELGHCSPTNGDRWRVVRE